MSSYEPGKGEIFLTLLSGVIFSPLYRDYVNRLELEGKEWMLDFGSGSGVCSKHLAGRLQQGGGYLACLDVSSSWNAVIRKTLKRYPNVEYLFGDITALHIPDASFDTIMCHFVLHDITADDRPEVFRHWMRVLKSNGKVFLREPVGLMASPRKSFGS
jgi:ubiquinone/menaquinone biosynthesis C-methylase UbiE